MGSWRVDLRGVRIILVLLLFLVRCTAHGMRPGLVSCCRLLVVYYFSRDHFLMAGDVCTGSLRVIYLGRLHNLRRCLMVNGAFLLHLARVSGFDSCRRVLAADLEGLKLRVA